MFRMRNVSDKFVEKIKTHSFMSNNIFSDNRALYKMMRKNKVKIDRPQMTIQ